MKHFKKHGAQYLALILSTIMITVSFTGSVFGAQAPPDTEASVVVESEDISEKSDSERNKKSGTATGEPGDDSVEETVTTDETLPSGTEKKDSSSDAVNRAAPSNPTEDTGSAQSSESAEELAKDNDENETSDDTVDVPSPEQGNQNTPQINHVEDSKSDLNDKSDYTQQTIDNTKTDEVTEYAPEEETTTTDTQNEAVLEFVIEDGVLVEYNGEGGDVVVPHGVTSIGYEAFNYCTSLTSITLPEGVTHIESFAFYNCYNLSNVSLPNSLTTIGDRAFDNCSSLTKITLSDSVTSIDYGAFSGCDHLTIYCSSSSEYIIDYACENEISYYGDKPFTISGNTLVSYNRSGGSVTVPNTVKTIAKNAFSKCWEVTDITLPTSTTIINDEAFSGCSGLKRISLPGIKKIGSNAFSDCSSLSSISLPNTLTNIEGFAFYNCSSLKSITIPRGITCLEYSLFEECSNLTTVTLPSTLKEIGSYVFKDCSSLKSIVIPKGIEYISYGLFENCTSLTNVSIPAGVKYIESRAFKGCTSLKSIVLPTGTTYIGDEAFANCTGLTSITIPASVNRMEAGVFDSSYNVVIRCPSNAKYVINYAKEWEIPYKTYEILAKKISLSKTSVTVGTGRSATIIATVSPYTATNKVVTWKSSNSKVAKVNSAGKITGVYKGTATITATAKDGSGVKASCTVTVLLPKPGNCRFTKWNNSKYNSCKISWNKVAGADGYQTLLCWTNGSHATTKIVKAGVLSQNCNVAVNHVSQFKVRAFYNTKSGRKYGAWSNVAFITPSPTKMDKRVWANTNPPMAYISWDIIYGCNGYNVFLTTNPNEKWYWNQSTYQYADSNYAYITKYRGSKLKRNKRYYVRVVTRRKQNGVFCTVPMPASNTYIGSFVIK